MRFSNILTPLNHDTLPRGVVTMEEWTRNPDSGIGKLLERFKRENPTSSASTCPQRGIRYRDTNKHGLPKGKPGRKPHKKDLNSND